MQNNDQQNKQWSTKDYTENRYWATSTVIYTRVRSLHFTTHVILPSFSGQSSAADTKATQTNWSHRYRNYMVIIIWLTITKYDIHTSNDNRSFHFYLEFVFPPSQTRLLIGFDYTYEQNGGYLIWSRNCLPFGAPGFIAVSLWALCCSSL